MKLLSLLWEANGTIGVSRAMNVVVDLGLTDVSSLKKVNQNEQLKAESLLPRCSWQFVRAARLYD